MLRMESHPIDPIAADSPSARAYGPEKRLRKLLRRRANVDGPERLEVTKVTAARPEPATRRGGVSERGQRAMTPLLVIDCGPDGRIESCHAAEARCSGFSLRLDEVVKHEAAVGVDEENDVSVAAHG